MIKWTCPDVFGAPCWSKKEIFMKTVFTICIVLCLPYSMDKISLFLPLLSFSLPWFLLILFVNILLIALITLAFFLSLTVILFCMAALIFPIGFYINEVGGQPYKLPNNTVVGSSYVLFVLSIFFTIVGLLFAGKVCLPGWGDGPSLDSWGVQCETERNGTHRGGATTGDGIIW